MTMRLQAIDMRGHGESSHSSRHLYSLETLVEDLHELVVRLSLNGRDWGGAWTRPWVLLGKGMGAAVAVAYAVRHVGRIAGLVLWEYDPEWPKDRLNFYPYQAAHFANQQAIGCFYNDKLQLAVRTWSISPRTVSMLVPCLSRLRFPCDDLVSSA